MQRRGPWSCSLSPQIIPLGLFKSTHPVPPYLQVRGGYIYCAALENEPHAWLLCQDRGEPVSGLLLHTSEATARTRTGSPAKP